MRPRREPRTIPPAHKPFARQAFHDSNSSGKDFLTVRWSQTLIPTMKETPEGAEIPSHILMVRAGLIAQLMAGAYTYLPLGLRALHKAERIVREEMDRAGAVELLMPALTPISLWQQTGRVESFGNVLIQFQVRRQNKQVHLALGPTHEEVITDLVARFVSSYRQLPITLYQIQTKFRNEERPRFGVLRTSEFVMKDAYSFDTSLEGLNASYDKMYAAYQRIFSRAGLDYLAVEAESGPIGGDASHEFMVPSPNGEDRIVRCAKCGYAANLERAETGRRVTAPAAAQPAADAAAAAPAAPLKPLTKIDTPQVGSIEQVSKLLKCKPHQMIKTLIYLADDQPVAILIRGDQEANEGKIRRALSAGKLELAPPGTIEQVTGAPVGFAGPVGLSIAVWADDDVSRMRNAITGANEADKHYVGVNHDRDFRIADSRFADLRNAGAGDPCPRCGEKLELKQAIEVGHVFKLGTKYSDALGAKYLDAHEQQHTLIMGCYGIGVNRIIASLVETSHDENGIIWPLALAPYEVLLIPINVKEAEVAAVADKLYEELSAAGVDVLLDDRDQRPGVKFKDADLIGIPLRVVIGGRSLADGQLEVKWRAGGEAHNIPLAGAAAKIAELLAERKKAEAEGRQPAAGK
ncbi:MAG TPA: proline--tRNA ligase [Pirellulales bacterium]|jgi:prolyl-tRNA synthetase|nr:proline--tRNA ligase [Pirellulales bacterium]